MAYTPYTVEGFGGLNVRDDPAQVGAGGAIDLSNVVVDGSGVLRSRPGYAAFGSTLDTFGTSTGCVVFHTNPYNQSTDPFFTVVSMDGSSTMVWTVLEDGTTSGIAYLNFINGGSGWINFAPPFHTAAHAYVATGAGVYREDYPSPATGTPSGTRIASTSKPRYITRTQASGRLVLGNFSTTTDASGGTNGSTSTVFFGGSNTTTFGSDDWVDVGETITALVLWNDQVFAFGTTTLFLFYGESVDSTGGVIFNYRPVAMNIGVIQEATVGQAACAGPDGVYFATSQGIWRTQGSAPVKVSRPIDPILTGDFLGSGVAGVDKIDRMACAGDRVFVSYGVDTDADGLTLVYDVPSGQWSRWDIGKGSAPTARVDSTREDELYYVDSGATKVMRFDPDVATDNASSMSWRYQSGWYDLGYPQEKFAGRSWLVGTGTPTFSVLTDYGSTDSNASAVTLGTSPVEARGEHLPVYQGRKFSHKLSGTGAVTVSQLGHNIVGMRRS